MYSAYRSIRAVAILMLITVNLSGAPSFSQAVKFIRHAADPLPLAKMSAGRATCAMELGGPVSATYAAKSTTPDSGGPCDTPTVNVSPMNPCNSAVGQIGVEAPKDRVPDELAAMGKTAHKILRPRDRALDTLEAENTSSPRLPEQAATAAATLP